MAKWDRDSLYRRIQQARAGAATYILHDGPPYITGTIHLGTALNKILKDMVVKSKTAGGFRAPCIAWLGIAAGCHRDASGEGAGSSKERLSRRWSSPHVPGVRTRTLSDQHRRDFKRLGVLGHGTILI